MPEDRIKIEGLSIRYWTNVGGLGDDDSTHRTVVLFHGNALSLDSWKKTKTLEELSSKGYRVFAIDLPAGKGSMSMSDKLSPSVLKNDPDRIMKVIDETFDALGVGDTRIAIVGPSMGGGFALAYAFNVPIKVITFAIYATATAERAVGRPLL